MNVSRAILGVFMLIDGLLLALLESRYLRLVNFDFMPDAYRRYIRWQMNRPEWLNRGLGAAESVLGLLVMTRSK